MARIMIVDDEQDLVILVKMILRREGHEVIGATSGEEALEKLNGTKPDLILLDIMMPDLDGWETLELIRKQDGLKDIPVSMLTAKDLTPEITARKDIGELVDYIQKPFTKDSLTKKVNSILEDLERIAHKKSRLSIEVGDIETITAYEIAARAERLHTSMRSTLDDLFEKTQKDDPDGAQSIKDAILSQQRAIELFRNKRNEIERRLKVKDTNV